MRLVLVLLAALLVAPAPAHAQRGGASRNPKELIKQAERLYDQKKYLEAAALLEKASESLEDTRIIYNIARAYDQAGKETEAISYYEKYLTDGEDAQLRKRSRLSIDRLRLQKEKEEKTAAATEAERKRLRAEAEEARKRAETERAEARRTDEANQQRLKVAYEEAQASRKRMQVTSIALGGVAVAGVGLGAFFGVQANGSRTAFNSATALDQKLEAKSATRSNALVADIGFGVGLVSAVAAILLYPKEPVAKPGKVRLTSAPQGTGAGMEVNF
jgi:tetratricopeptide (TPR) repeat protein